MKKLLQKLLYISIVLGLSTSAYASTLRDVTCPSVNQLPTLRYANHNGEGYSEYVSQSQWGYVYAISNSSNYKDTIKGAVPASITICTVPMGGKMTKMTLCNYSGGKINHAVICDEVNNNMHMQYNALFILNTAPVK